MQTGDHDPPPPNGNSLSLFSLSVSTPLSLFRRLGTPGAGALAVRAGVGPLGRSMAWRIDGRRSHPAHPRRAETPDETRG